MNRWRAGGQIGYRWQVTNWVFGLEAQGDWANLRNSNASVFLPLVGDTWTSKTRLCLEQRSLVREGRRCSRQSAVGSFYDCNWRWPGSGRTDRWGGTVGTGFEYGFAPNWSVGIEYDYLWRVSDSNTFLTPGLAPAVTAITANTRSDVNMITARLNYRFNWGSTPVVSKY